MDAKGSGGDDPIRDGTYTYEQFDLPSISAHIANSPRLQKIIGMKSCDPLPTMVILADFFSCIFLIISYHISSRNFLTGRDATTSVWFGIAVISICYTALRELAQIFVEHVRWFLSLWNYLDVATIVFVVRSLFQMWLEGEVDSRNSNATTLVMLTTALVWLNAIFFLRSTFMSFATFVGGIFKIVTDLIPFIVISTLILMAFGEMFFVDMLGEKGGCNGDVDVDFDPATDFCSFVDSLFVTYGLFVGGIELDVYANAAPRIRVIAVIFGFLVAIILLNVVIAIVGKSWDEVVQRGEEVVRASSICMEKSPLAVFAPLSNHVNTYLHYSTTSMLLDAKFWAYRLGFLIEVKGYESLWCNNNASSKMGALDKCLLFWDRRLSDLCRIFWPSKRYW